MQPRQVFLFILVSLFMSGPSIGTTQILSSQPKASARYIFFLHHRYIELFGTDIPHPEYGQVEYEAILSRFREEGFIVLSEKRDSSTRAQVYAKKIVHQIDSLLSMNVQPEHITVIGTSKGGYIAQYISTYMAHPKLQYVFVGAFQDRDIEAYPDIQICGNVLNIYDVGDFYGVSAVRRKETSKQPVPHFSEVALDLGLQHGFLYKALDAWLNPCIEWAKGNFTFSK